MNKLESSLLQRGLVKGHVVLASGRHSDEKFEFDNIVRDGYLLKRTASALGQLIVANYDNCDTIVTVANGANILAEPVSINVSENLPRNIRAVSTHKVDGEFELPENPNSVKGRQCVIVDDVFTHGTNTSKVASLLHEAEADLLGVAVVLNRNIKSEPELQTEPQNLQVLSLIHHPITDYPPEDCPHHN